MILKGWFSREWTSFEKKKKKKSKKKFDLCFKYSEVGFIIFKIKILKVKIFENWYDLYI